MSRFVEKEVRHRDSTTRGRTKIRRWEGPAADLTEFEASELPSGWVEKDKTETDGAQWIIYEATYGVDDDTPAEDQGLISRTWERDVVYDEKSIVLCPSALAIGTPPGGADPATRCQFAQWPQSVVGAAERYFKYVQKTLDPSSGVTEQKSPADFYWVDDPARGSAPFVPTQATPEQRAKSKELFETCLRLQEPVFRVAAPVLRKTEIVVSGTVLKVSSAYTGRFWSRASLINSEPTLPATALIDWAGLTDWSWLKMEPEVSVVNGGQVQLTQEYHGALEFETFIYGELI